MYVHLQVCIYVQIGEVMYLCTLCRLDNLFPYKGTYVRTYIQSTYVVRTYICEYIYMM